MSKIYHRSNRMDWGTPQWVINWLSQDYNLLLDVCAWPHNRKAPYHLSPNDDGLCVSWRGWLDGWGADLAQHACWMNPPYGRQIGRWTAKARREAAAGVRTVALLPSRPDTRWWRDSILQPIETRDDDTLRWRLRYPVRNLIGRVWFEGADNGATFPSCVVVFDNRTIGGETWYSTKQLKAMYS